MKLKSKFFIVAVIFLFVLAVNVASADENVTDAIDNDDAAIDENIAEIDVPSKVWVNGNDNITINSKESAAVNITGAVNYSGNIASGENKVPLKNLTVGKHNLFLSYLSNTTSFQKEFNLTVMKDSPYWDMEVKVADGEQVPYEDEHEMEYIPFMVTNVPKGMTGQLKFYVNDKLCGWENITEDNYKIDYEFSCELYRDIGLLLNYRLEYLGDDYFKPVNYTTYLKMTDFAIDIPSKVILGYDDEIIIRSVYQKKGTLEIYVDGELFKQMEIAQKYYDEDDPNSDWCNIYKFSLSHLKPNNSYNVSVVFKYKNKNGIVYRNITKESTVDVYNETKDYVKFPSWSSCYRYKYPDAFYIEAPKLDLDIKIDGKSVDYKYVDDCYEIKIKKLLPGYHDISVSYDGDSLFLKNTFNKTIFIYVEPEEDYGFFKQYEKGFLNFTLPGDAQGNMTIKIKEGYDETEYMVYKTVPVKGGKTSIQLPTGHIGTFIVKASFDGNYEIGAMEYRLYVGGYAKWSSPKYKVKINGKNSFTLTLPKDAKGNLTVAIAKDGGNFTNYTTKALKNGKVTINLPTNHPGKYKYETYFSGNYEADSEYDSYEVLDDAKWSSSKYEVKINEKNSISLTLPKDAKGNLTVAIAKDGGNFTNYTTKALKNGKVTINLPTNHVGFYTLVTSFKGNYEINEFHDYYDVLGVAEIVSFDNNVVDYNSKHAISLKLPKDAIGKLNLDLKKDVYEIDEGNFTFYKSVDLVNGEASIDVPTDEFTNFVYRAYYTGNYEVRNLTGSYEVNPIRYNDGIFYLANRTGTFYIYMDDELVKSVDVNGNALEVDVNHLFKEADKGNFHAEFRTIGWDYYDLYVKIKPIFDVDLKADDVSMSYGDKSTLDIEVFRNGKAVVEGKTVTVKIGSKKYSVSTNKNGVARFNLNQLPGKYTVKITYKTKTITKKLTVKNVLTFKKVKIKKSAKKLVLTAKLSKKLKGKKITFKFKGKKYVAKTDKKGVAKVTVKKSVLKKLKVGKKVSLSATYIKLTKKFTVKVQK